MVNIFNTQKPRDNLAPVPANVVAPMLIRVRRDNGDILTQSSSSDAKYLNCEILIADGPHKGAKIFARLVVEGSSDGAKTAQAISYGLVGSIVRSALGVNANDMSPAVEAKLANFDFEDLDKIRFVGKTGRIERGKLRDPTQGPDGDRYDDRATLACGVTPDMTKEWDQWKSFPRGFDIDDGLGGAMAPPVPPPNGAGDLSEAVEAPPWAD
jgi:hypothetical protein